MSRPLILAAIAIVCAGEAIAAERRELGAHQHGHGKLNIAIDGNKVAMELEAPGADIAGFEYAAKSDADMAAIKQATATLEKPLALFKVPDAAQCKVSQAKVEIETEEHEHDGHGKAAKTDDHHDHDHDHDHKHKDEAGSAHSAFHAEYELDCASPAEFKTLTLDYLPPSRPPQA